MEFSLTVSLISNILKAGMKKSIRFLSILMVLALAGCFSARSNSVLDKSLIGQPLKSYSGAKVKIAVNDFELKTSGLNAQAALALKEYFISILNTTNRFSIVAAAEADIIVSVGVVEFIPESAGGKSGVAGGGSSASGFMGGLLGENLSQANMQLNLRLIDRANSSVISSQDIQSQAVENPGRKIKTPQDKIFKAGLSEYAGTPMGKVICDCLIESGRYIVQNVPLSYYKN